MNAHDVAAKLPDIELLRQRCKALAVLERVIDGGDPYYDAATVGVRPDSPSASTR
ncbi:hypothetical protein ACWD69_05485 [Micromonospora chokoriensis]